MKIFLPVICSLLLVGCNDTAQTSSSNTESTVQTSSPSTKSESLPVPAAEKNTSATESAPTASVTPIISAVDGGALFAQKCAACHGSKAEKSALNKSQVIANLSEQQIQNALHGYQAGTYGKEMKALMQGQAKPLNNDQIDALAKYISDL